MKTFRSSTKLKGPQGSATLVVLSLVSIMAILVTAEFAATRNLTRELRLIEQRQIQRLNPPPPKPVANLRYPRANGNG